jgi:hypothetical protein
MTDHPRYRLIALSALPLCAAQPLLAAPEPLVVSQLPDPDPNYVPPPPERKAARRAQGNPDDSSTLDQVFENLGRVTGQLAKMGQQYRRGAPAMPQTSPERTQVAAEICNSVDNARSRGVDISARDKDCRH